MLLNQRIGIAVLGNPCSGKSEILKVLKMALEAQGQRIKVFRLSPRSFDETSFFGEYRPESLEFIDGAFVKVLRDVSALWNSIESLEGNLKREFIS